MTKLGPLTSQALGRSPYDIVVLGNGEADPREPEQRYDSRGRPINPETKRMNKDIVRSHNEVMHVIGVAEPDSSFLEAEREAERHFRQHIYEDYMGYRLAGVGRVLGIAGIWGVNALRQRILLYREYSQIPFYQLFQHEARHHNAANLLLTGLPVYMFGHNLRQVAAMKRSIRNSFWKRTAVQYVRLHLQIFVCLQRLSIIRPFPLFPSFWYFIPFTAESPIMCPPPLPVSLSVQSLAAWAGKALLGAAPFVAFYGYSQLWGFVTQRILRLLDNWLLGSFQFRWKLPLNDPYPVMARRVPGPSLFEEIGADDDLDGHDLDSDSDDSEAGSAAGAGNREPLSAQQQQQQTQAQAQSHPQSSSPTLPQPVETAAAAVAFEDMPTLQVQPPEPEPEAESIAPMRRQSTFSSSGGGAGTGGDGDGYGSEEDEFEMSATIISFDVETAEINDAQPPSMWSIELRQGNPDMGLETDVLPDGDGGGGGGSAQADGSGDRPGQSGSGPLMEVYNQMRQGPLHTRSMLTRLPAVMATDILAVITSAVVVAPYEAQVLQVLARMYRRRAGLPADDLNGPLQPLVSWTMLANFAGVELTHLAFETTLWLAMTGLAMLYQGSDENWTFLQLVREKWRRWRNKRREGN